MAFRNSIIIIKIKIIILSKTLLHKNGISGILLTIECMYRLGNESTCFILRFVMYVKNTQEKNLQYKEISMKSFKPLSEVLIFVLRDPYYCSLSMINL